MLQNNFGEMHTSLSLNIQQMNDLSETLKERNEELGAIQCKKEEILGYIGTTEKKLEAWCRKIYRHSLNETLEMIRQDGLIAIRRASFDQLKKSATVISQQYNRFLPGAGVDPRDDAENAIRLLTTAVTPSTETMKELYGEAEEGGEEA